jgi:hypothetical protein
MFSERKMLNKKLLFYKKFPNFTACLGRFASICEYRDREKKATTKSFLTNLFILTILKLKSNGKGKKRKRALA